MTTQADPTRCVIAVGVKPDALDVTDLHLLGIGRPDFAQDAVDRAMTRGFEAVGIFDALSNEPLDLKAVALTGANMTSDPTFWDRCRAQEVDRANRAPLTAQARLALLRAAICEARYERDGGR